MTKVLLTNVFVEGSYVQHEEEVRVYKKIRAQARIERRLVLDFFANSLESSVSGIGLGLRQLEDLVDVLAEDSAAGLSPVSRARHFQRPSESISFLQYQLDATKRLVDDGVFGTPHASRTRTTKPRARHRTRLCERVLRSAGRGGGPERHAENANAGLPARRGRGRSLRRA